MAVDGVCDDMTARDVFDFIEPVIREDEREKIADIFERFTGNFVGKKYAARIARRGSGDVRS